MKNSTVADVATTSAGDLPRLIAPLAGLGRGTGVFAVGAGWRRDKRPATTIEHDSVGEALSV